MSLMEKMVEAGLNEAKPVRANWLAIWWARQWQAGLTICVLRLIEVTTSLAIWATVGYVGFWLVYGDSGDLRSVRMVALVKLLGDSWQIVLLVLFLLLFGRAIRMFLERLKSAFGVEADSIEPADDRPALTENPKTAQGGKL